MKRKLICILTAMMILASACSSDTVVTENASSSAAASISETAETTAPAEDAAAASSEVTEVTESIEEIVELEGESVSNPVVSTSSTKDPSLSDLVDKEALVEVAKDFLEDKDKLELLSDAYGWAKILRDASIKFEGTDVELKLGVVLKDLLDGGFTTDIDTTEMLDALSSTEDVVIEFNGKTIVIKLINPYNEPIEIGKALVGSISFSREEGADADLTINDLPIANMSRDEFLEYFPAVYESDDHSLVYRYYVPEIHKEVGPATANHGVLLLDTHGYAELILEFSDTGLPEKVTLNAPWLLYFGLQDVFEEEEIEAMKPAEVITAIDLRNHIVDDLLKALERTKFDFEIDHSTGVVSVNNAVLFAVNEYEVTEEGKEFLDTFIKVFSGVLMDPEYRNYVEEIVYEGNTDTKDTYEFNLTLSQNRAEAVMDYCCNSTSNDLEDDERAFITERSRAVGYSYSNPIYDAEGNVDMAASRRVDIRFRLGMN